MSMVLDTQKMCHSVVKYLSLNNLYDYLKGKYEYIERKKTHYTQGYYIVNNKLVPVYENNNNTFLKGKIIEDVLSEYLKEGKTKEEFMKDVWG